MSWSAKLGRVAAVLASDRVRPELGPASLETMEPRLLLASHPVVTYIPNQTVLAGSPLYIPLNATDADGDAISWTVTSNKPGVVSTYVPKNNRSLRISTAGGDMTFQLFEDKAPRATARIIELANSDFYDGVTFHRVINNFMIQGGDPTGTGGGGSPLPDFDDQFHPDLQHNRAGLLSMAKSGDDTNDSQFFITDVSNNYPRHLDFNHTIFGLQTSGEAVRDAISNTPVGANDKPTTPQVMTDVSVFTDTQNGVAMLKVPAGVTSGTAQITVRARDATGRVIIRRFNVTVRPDTHNSAPYLGPVPKLTTEQGTAFSFRMTSTDVDGGTAYYDAFLGDNAPQGVTGQINRSNGRVTLTPPANFTGTFDLTVRVRDLNATGSGDVWDAQTVTVHVADPVDPDPWDADRGDDVAGHARFIAHNMWQHNKTIDTPTDHDWVRFTLTQRSRVIVRAAGSNGTDVRLLLRGPNNPNATLNAPNTAVAVEGAVQTALVRAGGKALDPGTYWVRVDGMNMVVPSYNLRVEVMPLPGGSQPAAKTANTALAAVWDRARRAEDAGEDENAPADVLLESEPILAFLA